MANEIPKLPSIPIKRRALFGFAVAASAGGLVACSGRTTHDGTAAASAPTGSPSAVPAAPQGDHVRVLGVNGGPILSTAHSQPALALLVGTRVYLIDCGGNTAQRLVDAGIGFAGLGNVFTTHHHADHVAGLTDVALLGWTYTPSPVGDLDVWGPLKIDAVISGMQQSLGEATRLFSATKPPRKVTAHTISVPATGSVEVMRDDLVKVTATRVFHGPEVPDAYAYRFDILASGRSVVFSGDTAGPNDNLIALARGTDVLFHEVQMNSAVEELLVQRAPTANQAGLREHLFNSHTDVIAVPQVAQKAGARHLVLCHYVPADLPIAQFHSAVQDAAHRAGFNGRLTAPSELDVIPV
ncbi:MBL fold metallo-hydrolase [Rhodococcus sp. APC 3903]|uniref:MBL fold metallo-hydrolase n=1 Tax=Rhodococcus sp. APC 3903 TaxID=3035193 RepID=UPI0025B45A91|nr:MBL fold metallo-hydrolase [Rhodococcus sp. APC 3903]MDN3460790.1 MBL fold metallo-hydrolase [Rhodococcus sp. APC 3903]